MNNAAQKPVSRMSVTMNSRLSLPEKPEKDSTTERVKTRWGSIKNKSQ
jgi:hypothetical protein